MRAIAPSGPRRVRMGTMMYAFKPNSRKTPRWASSRAPARRSSSDNSADHSVTPERITWGIPTVASGSVGYRVAARQRCHPGRRLRGVSGRRRHVLTVGSRTTGCATSPRRPSAKAFHLAKRMRNGRLIRLCDSAPIEEPTAGRWSGGRPDSIRDSAALSPNATDCLLGRRLYRRPADVMASPSSRAHSTEHRFRDGPSAHRKPMTR